MVFDIVRIVESTGLGIQQCLTIWTKGSELVMKALMFEIQGVKGTSFANSSKTDRREKVSCASY